MSFFPSHPYDNIQAYVEDYAEQIRRAFSALNLENLRSAAAILEGAMDRRSNIFVCGNGGSAAIANHFVCDHSKGIRSDTDVLPRVTSLSSNVEILTAIANDFSYERIFEFQLSSLAAEGDVLVAVSSSGNSPNIIEVLKWARQNHVTSVALTGFEGGEARKVADVTLHVQAANYGVIEDVHQSLMHILAQYIRQKRLHKREQLGLLKF